MHIAKFGHTQFRRIDRGEHYLPVRGHFIDVVSLGQAGIAVAGVPVEVDLQRLSEASHFDVGQVNIFDHATPGIGRLKTQAYLGAYGFEVVGHHVADAARGFAAAGEEAVAVAGNAIADHHVFGGTVHPQAVGIAAGFEAEIVVVATDVAIFNQYPIGRIDVDAVGTGTPAGIVVVDGQILDGHLGGIQNMHSPETGFYEFGFAQRNIAAILHQQETRPFAIVIDYPAQAFGHVFAAHFPVIVPEHLAPAIHQSPARNGHVVLIDGGNQCCRPFHFDTGHPGRDQGIIQDVFAAQENNPFGNIQIDIASEKNGTYAIAAGLETNHAPAGFGTGIDGPLNGFGAELRCIGKRSVIVGHKLFIYRRLGL